MRKHFWFDNDDKDDNEEFNPNHDFHNDEEIQAIIKDLRERANRGLTIDNDSETDRRMDQLLSLLHERYGNNFGDQVHGLIDNVKHCNDAIDAQMDSVFKEFAKGIPPIPDMSNVSDEGLQKMIEAGKGLSEEPSPFCTSRAMINMHKFNVAITKAAKKEQERRLMQDVDEDDLGMFIAECQNIINGK